MVFRWDSYLELAREQRDSLKTYSGDLTDAKLRSSISRTYYAVFNIAVEYLRDVEREPILNAKQRQLGGEVISREELNRIEKALRSVHQHIQQSFKKSTGVSKADRIRQSVAMILGQLCDERKEADYNKEYAPKLATLTVQIRDADTLIGYIDQLKEITKS